MATVYDTDQALATFRFGGIDPNLFLLVNWQGTEAVSELYKFEVELASTDENIDLENLLGRRASLAVINQEGEPDPWHGIVTAIKQTKRDETYAYYVATLEPQLALLRLFRQSRIYAGQHSGGEPDLSDVIRMVLEQIGLKQEGEPSPSFTPDYAIRIPSSDLSATRSDFICQFEESNLDFLKRKLEHYGVYFWFEQGPDREVVVFGNQLGQQPANAIEVFWRGSDQINTESDKIAIHRFDHGMQVLPKSVVLREFSIQQPSLDLTINTEIDPESNQPLDRFDGLGIVETYGSHYKKQDQGSRIAKLRAEELAAMRNTYQAESNSPGIRAGYSIHLQEHYQDKLNAKYYVISAEHQGRQSLPRQTTANDLDNKFYSTVCTVIPADVQYRPPRTTRKPRVIGFLSAIIESEGDGEYAEMNEYGCYRIRFLFAAPGSGQQGEANSAWVRMATPYAGSQHGLNLPLLKGTEVLVSFLGGDPDRPVIISAIPNEENPSLRNQDNASQPVLQTAGQNMLSFEDKKDGEFARLSTPKAQSTIHLGNDTNNPDATGVRIATVGHMGETSSSYIKQIPGVYTQEIGKSGKVGNDVTQAKAVKAAMAGNNANNLMAQALMPEVEPAVQMKALNAQQIAAAASMDMVSSMLAAALNANPKNDEYIAKLKANLSSLTDKANAMGELASSVASGNKSAADALQQLAANNSTSSSTDTKGADKEPEKEKETFQYGSSTPNTDGLEKSVHNQMYYGATNNIMMGATTNIALSVAGNVTVGARIDFTAAASLNINEGVAYNIKSWGCKDLGTMYLKKSVLISEETADKDLKAGKYSMMVGELDVTAPIVTFNNPAGAYSVSAPSGLFSVDASSVEMYGVGHLSMTSEALIQLKAGTSKAYVSPVDLKLDAAIVRIA